MRGNQKWKFLQEVTKPYALEILEELQKKPMRFSELKKVCLSQKTLTTRLHELEEINAIQTIVEKPKKQRIIVFYSLTQKGKQAVELALQFIKI